MVGEACSTDEELAAWKPNTQGIQAPWRSGDCDGHGTGVQFHKTQWCYCRRNRLKYRGTELIDDIVAPEDDEQYSHWISHDPPD